MEQLDDGVDLAFEEPGRSERAERGARRIVRLGFAEAVVELREPDHGAHVVPALDVQWVDPDPAVGARDDAGQGTREVWDRDAGGFEDLGVDGGVGEHADEALEGRDVDLDAVVDVARVAPGRERRHRRVDAARVLGNVSPDEDGGLAGLGQSARPACHCLEREVRRLPVRAGPGHTERREADQDRCTCRSATGFRRDRPLPQTGSEVEDHDVGACDFRSDLLVLGAEVEPLAPTSATQVAEQGVVAGVGLPSGRRVSARALDDGGACAEIGEHSDRVGHTDAVAHRQCSDAGERPLLGQR